MDDLSDEDRTKALSSSSAESSDDVDGKRKRRAGNADSRKSFRESRKSYVAPAMIKRQEAETDSDSRVSMRRASRAYSNEAPSSDLSHPQTRIIIEWRDLGYTVLPERTLEDIVMGRKKPEPKVLLNGLHGIVRPGQLIGIMGPSGSGKSVFLNLLAGRLSMGTMTGELLVNGKKRSSAWRRAVAFVEQDTEYLDTRLKVSELVQYYADLTIPKRYGPEEKVARIQHTVTRMGLDHILDSTIGGDGVKGISGGERKRLAVALELLQEPKVLLLDEPTSGLDSKTAADLVRFLYQLAIADDLTIIMTVHQPRMSIVSKFERLLIMAQGSTVFFGDVDEAIKFYQKNGFTCPDHENPADFFLQVLVEPPSADGKQPVEILQKAWAKRQFTGDRMSHFSVRSVPSSGTGSQSVHPYMSPHNLGRWSELKVVTLRYYRVVMRDKAYFRTTNALVIISCFIVSFTFFQIPDDGFAAVQNRLGFIFYVPFDRTAIALMTVFLNERNYSIRRERYRSIARVSSYYWALFIIQLPLWILFLLFTVIVQYYIVGLRYVPFTALLIFLGFYVLIMIQALAVGIILAAGFQNIQIALTVGFLYIVIVSLFNGTVVNTNNVTWILRWIRYISPSYYLLSGLAQNEFDGQTLNGEPGEYWMNLFGLDNVSVMWCAGALMIITAFTFVAGLAFFRMKSRPKVNL